MYIVRNLCILVVVNKATFRVIAPRAVEVEVVATLTFAATTAMRWVISLRTARSMPKCVSLTI